MFRLLLRLLASRSGVFEEAVEAQDYEEESANHHYLAFSFDLNSICLTFSMMERFYQDCSVDVTRYARKYPEVLFGSVEEIHARVCPAFTTRFAEFQNSYLQSAVMEKATCTPLVCKLGVKPTNHEKDISPKSQSSGSDLEGLRVYASSVAGRDLAADDPRLTELLMNQRRGKEVAGATGNLYSHSAWSMHLQTVMLARGVAVSHEDPIIERLKDTSLCLRLTARQKLGLKPNSPWNSLLRGGELPDKERTAAQVAEERAAVAIAHNALCADFHRVQSQTAIPDDLADRRLKKRHNKAMAQPIFSIGPVQRDPRDDVPAPPAP
jgi:hypothetical protein